MLKKTLNKVRNDKKGFTLAELLIVVAIIAVLVAISIPIFTAQLEKSREAVDLANLRAAYAEASADLLTNDASTFSKVVKATQTQAGWQGSNKGTVGDLTVDAKTKDSSWTVFVDTTNNKVTIE